jgi:hypothetical protein
MTRASTVACPPRLCGFPFVVAGAGGGRRRQVELATRKLSLRDIFTARIAPSRFVVVRGGARGVAGLQIGQMQCAVLGGLRAPSRRSRAEEGSPLAVPDAVTALLLRLAVAIW